MNNLWVTRAIQNKQFYDDCYDDDREQNFIYFIGNHPYLFQEFTDSGYITEPEIHYIIQHFQDYSVDPRTFENEFKRALRENLPRYNNMKMIELNKEIFDLVDDKYTRKIVTNRTQHLMSEGTNKRDGHNSNSNDDKSANRQNPMETTGSATIDNIVNWINGASTINENVNTGQQWIDEEDKNELENWNTDDGNSKETYKHHGNPVEHIDKIWNYLLKPKAIEYLVTQLAPAFILIY